MMTVEGINAAAAVTHIAYALVNPLVHLAGKDTKHEPMALSIINCKRTDVNVLSPGGDTPLHAAVAAHATSSLAALIARAPKFDVLDAGGCTALHRAGYAACAAREREAEKRAVMLVKGKQPVQLQL